MKKKEYQIEFIYKEYGKDINEILIKVLNEEIRDYYEQRCG